MEYLLKLKESKYLPNFFCSKEYIEKAGWKEINQDNISIIVDDTDNIMLPSLNEKNEVIGSPYFIGFSNYKLLDKKRNEFLDYEFIFDPSSANTGIVFGGDKKWKKVYKNINQCSKDIGGKLELFPLSPKEDTEEFLLEISKDIDSWYDPEVFIKYILYGENRIWVKDSKKRNLGLLIWDENYKYVNFRYCILRKGIRGLSDFSRILFFSYINNIRPKKLINDGGCLNSKSLYWYKNKLNPIRINKIYGGRI